MKIKDIQPNDIIENQVIRRCIFCEKVLVSADFNEAVAIEGNFKIITGTDSQVLICQKCTPKSIKLCECILTQLIIKGIIKVEDNFAEKLKDVFNNG